MEQPNKRQITDNLVKEPKIRQVNGPNRISWHPAFIEAIQLELEDYKNHLEFHTEYQLTTEPLRIDCLIIKKVKDVVIKKNIASIFKEVNLMEYKSPNNCLTIKNFYRVYSYACLYVSMGKIPVTQITISFIRSHYPDKLIQHLKDIKKYTVEKTNPGIYTVTGDTIPIQIINSRYLDTEENLWLKNLNNRLNPIDVINLGKEAEMKDETVRTEAYMNVIVHANKMAVEEAMKMRKDKETLEEMLERIGVTAEWEARGEIRSEEKWRRSEALDIAKNMVNLGLPMETIISATRLEFEKVKELYE